MNLFKQTSPTEADPFFNRIGKDWMLLSSTDGTHPNTMTVSWGCIGKLWNKPVAICFIRPQRHSYGLVESSTHLTLAHLPEGYRDALALCGKASGRDCNKFEAAGLTCSFTENGIPYPAESDEVLVCRKLYADDLREGAFIDPSILPTHYPASDLHRFYVCEIEQVLVRDR